MGYLCWNDPNFRSFPCIYGLFATRREYDAADAGRVRRWHNVALDAPRERHGTPGAPFTRTPARYKLQVSSYKLQVFASLPIFGEVRKDRQGRSHINVHPRSSPRSLESDWRETKKENVVRQNAVSPEIGKNAVWERMWSLLEIQSNLSYKKACTLKIRRRSPPSISKRKQLIQKYIITGLRCLLLFRMLHSCIISAQSIHLHSATTKPGCSVWSFVLYLGYMTKKLICENRYIFAKRLLKVNEIRPRNKWILGYMRIRRRHSVYPG